MLTALGCASTEDRQRGELVGGLNKWLGQYKDARIVQVGPPDRCATVPNGEGQICEWQTERSQVLFSYDASGIARSWSYMDGHFGRIESEQYSDQNRQSQGSIWQSVKETFRAKKFGAGIGGPSGSGR
jgi:hypothetical protein